MKALPKKTLNPFLCFVRGTVEEDWYCTQTVWAWELRQLWSASSVLQVFFAKQRKQDSAHFTLPLCSRLLWRHSVDAVLANLGGKKKLGKKRSAGTFFLLGVGVLYSWATRFCASSTATWPAPSRASATTRSGSGPWGNGPARRRQSTGEVEFGFWSCTCFVEILGTSLAKIWYNKSNNEKNTS